TTVPSAYTSGGISNVFMSSLKIQQIYNNTKALKGDGDLPIGIFIALMGGVLMIVTACFSFIAIGIAIFIRTAVLLFVMALSPFYFVGMIFPQIKAEVSDRIKDLFFSQLLFLPVYLLLMYISLRLISSTGFNSIFYEGISSNGTIPQNEGPFGATYIGIVIRYVIAILFINAPLIAAIKFGAIGAKWAPGLSIATGLGKFMGGMAKNAVGVVGRNTIGRVAGTLGKGFDSMAINAQKTAAGRIGSSALRAVGVSQAIRGGINSAAKSKYGGSKSTEDYDKEDKERAQTLSGISRNKEHIGNINTFVNSYKNSGGPTTAEIDKMKKSLSSLDSKELENIEIDILKNKKFASHIPSGKMETLMKSDKLTAEQKGAIEKARNEGFEDIVKNPNGGDELINIHLNGRHQDVAKLPSSILKQRDVAKHLDPAMLKAIANGNMGKPDRDAIRAIIESYISPTTNSTIDRAQKYLKTNFTF
ncbi:MAG: hypothetical protein AAB683_01165, partial [Patescibacteria group bacterium]